MDIKLSGASKNCTCLRESIKKGCDDGDNGVNFRMLQAVTRKDKQSQCFVYNYKPPKLKMYFRFEDTEKIQYF